MPADDILLDAEEHMEKAIEHLRHPNILEIFDYSGLEAEECYIVTEFVDGDNLSDVLGKLQPTAADLTLLLRRLAAALERIEFADAIGHALGSRRLVDQLGHSGFDQAGTQSVDPDAAGAARHRLSGAGIGRHGIRYAGIQDARSGCPDRAVEHDRTRSVAVGTGPDVTACRHGHSRGPVA